MCNFCEQTTIIGHEVGQDYPIIPCGNGDLGVRAKYMDKAIVLFNNRLSASGYFDINFCPICGRKLRKEG